MARLLIDAGNSRLKWGWGGAQGVDNIGVLDNLQLESLVELWGAYPVPSQIWMVNSAGPERQQQLERSVAQCWGLPLQVVDTALRYRQLRNGYRSPLQLGSDRWLGMVAAWQRIAGAFCLLDCGTAVTLDFVDQRGAHQGGLILPGVDSSFEALLQRAPHLHSHYQTESTLLLGRETSEALRSAKEGSERRVAEVLAQLRAVYGPFSLLLTGGGAERMQQQLKVEAERVEALLLEGVWWVSEASVERTPLRENAL